MWVHLPRLDVTASVEFLLDTGADTTSLHLGAINSLGLHPSAFRQEPIIVRGVGGPMSYIQENAFIFVQDRTPDG